MVGRSSQQIKEDQPGAMPLEFVMVSALLDFVCPRLETRFNKLDHQVMETNRPTLVHWNAKRTLGH